MRLGNAIAATAAACLAALAGCAGTGAPTAGRDLPAYAYPWCADQARAAAEQPVPKDADESERGQLRGRHLSQACARSIREVRDAEQELRFPDPHGPDRLPHPHPIPEPTPSVPDR